MKITSGGTDGPSLDDDLSYLGNNIYGSVPGSRTPKELALTFARAGWRARKSSHTEYEIEHTWARLEFFRSDDETTAFAGIVDPNRATRLADTFTGLGLTFQIELWDPDSQTLIQELRPKGEE